ncbi:cytochrome-c peroxidase [Methylobacter sp. BlB1]|uniref:cytochrome-c peroxidase n=1 Tax=Methylobacter sp. BlB1 TaxID=2785914 RepID=UPI001E599EB6|nr:cytochrome c peroxidase [Methylobacter sp. BlB1]
MIHFALSSRLKLKTMVSAVSLVLSALTPSLTFAVPANDTDFPARNAAKEQLGKFLFYDKILSGNKNTSCATCHHPLAATGDGLSLGVGEGGKGLGIMRDTGTGSDAIHERVPRNAPFVFNLGASEFVRIFHDGRVEQDSTAPSGFRTPAGGAFLLGVDNALSAQAAFPPTSNTEMAGQAGENEVADAAAAGNLPLVWHLLTQRVMAIEEYRTLFAQAYPGLKVPEQVTYSHIANAIGAFEAAAYRADNSPYDYYMLGQTAAMSKNAVEGMKIFNKAGCASCHSGKFQTDHAFHALGMPQIGPGKGDGLEGHDDYGREQVTGDANDRYKFRTPSLRNVALTGPWGHDGAYNTLEAVVRHHLNPEQSLEDYDVSQAVLPSRSDLDEQDFIVHNDATSRFNLANSIEINPVALTDAQVKLLLDYLHALTDPSSLDLRSTAPKKVPSGLSLAD